MTSTSTSLRASEGVDAGSGTPPRARSGSGRRGAPSGVAARRPVRIGGVSPRSLTPPEVPDTFTARPRLHAMVDEAVRRPLTLVTGPPGAGKTVLMAGWARADPDRRVLWAGFDGETDPAALVATVLDAMAGIAPGGGSMAGSTGADPGRPSRGPSRPVVVLDDHRGSGVGACGTDAVRRLRRVLPAEVPLVVTGREDPAFPLSRMRLDGDLSEIRQGDLAFRAGEAAAMVSAVAGRALAAGDVARLVERTEGWAVGLHLAGLLLRHEPDPSAFVRRFAGQSEYVAEYLVEEVLETLPPDLVRFLLLTSVVERMTPELATAVTGSPDAGARLEDLVARNLFVVRLDTEHHEYRYHRLFAQLLRYMLPLREPRARIPAHRRAAAWYAAAGRTRPAVRHLVEAGDVEGAFGLATADLARRVAGCIPAEEHAGGLEGIPDAFLDAEPQRRLAVAAVGRSGRRGAEAGRVTVVPDGRLGGAAEVVAALLGTLAAESAGDAAGTLAAARTVAVAAHRRPAGTRTVVRPGSVWMEELAAVAPTMAACSAARARLWLGDPVGARAELDASGLPGPAAGRDGAAGPRSAAEFVGEVQVPAVRALVLAELGLLRDARRHGEAALEAAARSGVPTSPVLIEAHVALAVVGHRRDDQAVAEAHLAEAARLAEVAGHGGWSVAVELHRVRGLLAEGRTEAARLVLGRLADADAAGVLPAAAARACRLAGVECRLAAGDVAGAAHVLGSLGPEDPPALLAARVALRSGRPAEAEALLAAAGPAGNPAGEVERLVARARVLMQLGRHLRARDELRRAVDLARPERDRRPFLDPSGDLAELLESLRTPFPDPFLDDLVAGGAPAAARCGAAPGLAGGLTERERVVLDYLPSHLSQQQIAARLFISPNTLKTHLKALYRKLGVSSRSAAVDAAAAHGLL